LLELNRIYNMDCVEGMKLLPNECIDLTVTSPPYDNLRDYNNEVTWNFEKFKEIAKELFRITKPGGVVVWVVGDATIKGSETGTSFRQALFFKDCGFNLHDTMIYQKDACPFPETNRYYPAFEYMFIFSKGKPKTANLIADKPNKKYGKKITGSGRNSDGTLKPHTAVKNKTNRTVKKFGVRTNVWLYSVGKWKITKDEYAYKHPAMFPEQLAEDHILTWSNPGDIVFDPFLGSGTTAKMALLNNRHFIGFEISKEYCKIATKRISDITPEPEKID
jgi:DNA modification methylase